MPGMFLIPPKREYVLWHFWGYIYVYPLKVPQNVLSIGSL
jgi:hypothetical protein